jgi:arsenite/tail-anchored protein-transporting ATPase
MRVLFFTGKGGVGKSTISAATAWQLSQSARVLIVSLDPAHNLGDVFGVTLNHRRHRYSERLVLQEVDVARRSRAYLQREVDVLNDTYRYMQAINIQHYFSLLKYSPGVEEYTLITSVEETLHDAEGFDYVLFDTPPTGLTLRLLALPHITLTWLERLVSLRRLILDRRHTIGKIRGRPGAEGAPTAGANGGEQRLAYDESEDRVLTRLLGLQRRYEALIALLSGSDSGVVLVFNPDLLSSRESARLIEGLRDIKMPLRLLVDNKVQPHTEALARRVEAELLASAGDVPVERVQLSDALVQGGEGPLFQIPEQITSQLWS